MQKTRQALEELDSPVRNGRDYAAPTLQPLQPMRLPRSGSLTYWITPAVLFACGTFLYLQLFVLPFTPRYFSGDQAIYLNHAARMVDGDLIYRDFDHFTTPGTDVLYTALFRIFGVRIWIPNAMLVLVGVLMAYLSIVISKRVISGWPAYLPAIVFLTVSYSSYRDATHHWYSTLAATASIAVVLERRSPGRIAWAGFLWGLGTFFTQSVALGGAGLALFLIWESPRLAESKLRLVKKELVLFASFIATIVACSSYFIYQVGLKRFLYFTVVFVAKFYPADDFNNWRVYMTGHPALGNWMNWPDAISFAFIHGLLPLVYVLFLVRAAKPQRPATIEPWPELILINIFGISLFMSVVPAPAFSRLCTVSLPGLILFVWFLKAPFMAERVLLRVTWCAVMILVIARPLIEQVHPKQLLSLPVGRTAFVDPILYEKCKWVSERTSPAEFFFGDQFIAFSLRLRNAGPVSFLRPTDYTRPEEVRKVVSALEKHKVRFVSWYSGLDRNGVLYPQGDHLKPVRDYLRQHYRIAKVFANEDEIWERTERVSANYSDDRSNSPAAR